MASKRERKIAVLKKWLPSCSSYSVYVHGNIPKDKFQGALSTYVGNVNYNDVLGLIDETIWGNGKKGMLFTEKGYYYTYSGTKGKYVKYSDLKSMSNWAGYNCTALNEVLQKLYEIDTEPSTLELAGGLFSGLFDILETVADAVDEWEMAEQEKENFLLEDEQNVYIEGSATECYEDPDIIKLKKLNQMLEQGLITEEEYNTKRIEIIHGI